MYTLDEMKMSKNNSNKSFLNILFQLIEVRINCLTNFKTKKKIQ